MLVINEWSRGALGPEWDHLEPVSCAETSRFDVRSGGDGELGLDPVGLWDPQLGDSKQIIGIIGDDSMGSG